MARLGRASSFQHLPTGIDVRGDVGPCHRPRARWICRCVTDAEGPAYALAPLRLHRCRLDYCSHCICRCGFGAGRSAARAWGTGLGHAGRAGCRFRHRHRPHAAAAAPGRRAASCHVARRAAASHRPAERGGSIAGAAPQAHGESGQSAQRQPEGLARREDGSSRAAAGGISRPRQRQRGARAGHDCR